ncbi:MAG: polyprenol phosphomannose-dependent alpha 1,6 mannosyltransferase MptB [Actinomycetota bacterium]|nr:polyprenol phosphomannose-dependent alpha 1,6 mannosyltransferase MptB [Actinomycetota bacterium]
MKHRFATELERQEAEPPSFRRYGIAGLLAGSAVVAGAMAGGPSFVSHMPGAWFFGTPGGPLGSVGSGSARASALSMLGVYGGLAALSAVWWRMLRALWRRPGVPVRSVLRVLAVWAVPFVLAPPLFSRDVYSYAGQGAMVSFHINPYVYGPGVLGVTRFNLLAGPFWANTPSPYGPTFLSLDGLAAQLSGHQVLADLLLLRLLEVVGVALVALALPTLARSVGRDPAAAVVLGAGSPIVLSTLVGGAHNDGLMVGLLVAGLAAWKRYGPVPGIVLCAVAAGVKAPAALGIVLIGWNWGGSCARIPERLGRTVGALGIGAATLAALSAISGVGWGWVLTLTAEDRVSTGVTPVDALAHVLTGLLHLVGVPAHLSSVRAVTSVLGMLVAVAVGTWLLWESPRLGPLRALGLTLLVLALLGPVLWAWYLTWGLVLLAAVATGWTRRVVVWLAVGESLIGASSVLHMLRAFASHGALSDAMVVIGIAAVTFAVVSAPFQVHRTRWAALTLRRSVTRPATVPASPASPTLDG